MKVLSSAIDRLAEKDIIETNLKDEIETFAFNLFDEDDDIVQEAKAGLRRVQSQIEKLVAKGDNIMSTD